MAKAKPGHDGRTKWNKIGFVYVCIWVSGFLVFQLYLFISSLLYLFTNYDIFYAPEFVGSDNYVKSFTKDREFWNSMVVTLKYTLITVPDKVALALIIVVILSRNLKGINFIRTMYYIPSLLSGSVAVAILWKVLSISDGFINSFLGLVYIGLVKWLETPDMAVITVCMLEVQQLDSSMVLFLSTLRQAPQSLHEAARIDGASKSRMFFKITLPMITSVVFFNIIIQLIATLQNLTPTFVVTSGGPNKAIYVLGMKLYADVFKHFKMGYARATSWILFMVILVMTIVLFVTSKKRIYYDNQEDGMKEKKTKDGITYVVLGIVGVVILLPVIWMSLACFKINNEILGSLSPLPQGWSPEVFIKGWETTGIYTYARYFINTFTLVAPTTLLMLVSCFIVAHGSARSDFPGSQLLFMALIATLMLPNAIIIIPRCALFNKLGWLDSYMTFYAPVAVGCYPFFMFMMVQFLRGLPRDLDESACIDGCDPFQYFIQILPPPLRPVLFPAGPFQFLWTQNDLFSTNIYINTVSKFPLSLAFRVSIDVTSNIEWNQVMSMAPVPVIPLTLPFFAAQKYFVGGIAISGLKGRLGKGIKGEEIKKRENKNQILRGDVIMRYGSRWRRTGLSCVSGVCRWRAPSVPRECWRCFRGITREATK